MYIPVMNMPINKVYKPFGTKNAKNLSFGNKIDAISKKQTSELFNKYLKNFAAENMAYEAEGNSILQPCKIPLETLQNIAQKELSKMQQIPIGHKLFIITGRIGGGKTTFIKQTNLHQFCYAPDADEIKLLLPGYKEFGSSYVHKASCTINATNLSEALKKGVNTIFQTATTVDYIDDVIDEARDYKYDDIILIHIDTAEDVALERAKKRGDLTGRKIDPNIIKERKYIDTFVSVYENPARGLSQFIVYNNNGDYPVKTKSLDFNNWHEILTYVTECSD